MTDPAIVAHERNVVEAGRFTPRADGPDDEIDLAPYFRSLAARWHVVLGAAVLSAFAVVAVMSMLPLMYEATATLVVVPAQGETGTQPSATPFRILLENNVLATEVTKKFALDQPPYELSPQEFIRSAARVEDVRGLNILLVKVKLRDDRQRAADVANAVAHGMVSLAQQIRDQEAALVSGQLKGPMERARRQLDEAEGALRTRREHAQLDVRKSELEGALDERQRLASLTSRLADERARLAQAEQELGRHNRIVDVARVPGLSAALFDAARRDAAAQVEEPLSKPRVVERDPRAAAPNAPEKDPTKSAQGPAGQKTQQESTRERPAPGATRPEESPLTGLDLSNPALNPVFEVLEFQVATSRSRVAGLEKQLGVIQRLSTQMLTKGLYSDEVELERLESERALLQRVYEDIAFQYEQARASVARRSAQLQVINEAVSPERPLTRGRALGGGMGFAVGGFLGCVWVLGTRRRPVAGASR
jgi:polysaccharide biosynthesis transport protein